MIVGVGIFLPDTIFDGHVWRFVYVVHNLCKLSLAIPFFKWVLYYIYILLLLLLYHIIIIAMYYYIIPIIVGFIMPSSIECFVHLVCISGCGEVWCYHAYTSIWLGLVSMALLSIWCDRLL